MRYSFALGWFLPAAILWPGAVSAQFQIGLGGGLTVPTGEYWEGAEKAPAITGQLAYRVSTNGQLGVGVGYSSLGVTNADEGIAVFDIALIARYFLPSETSRFYVGGMIGYSRQASSALNQSLGRSFDVVSGGSAVGPTIGVQIPLSSVYIELAVDVLRDVRGNWQLEDGESAPAIPIPSRGSGLRVIPRVGIATASARR